MKTLLFSYKFLFVTLMSLPLALCSKDNDSETENSFESVTLDLSDVNLKKEDPSFIVNGFRFNNFRSESAEFSTTSTLGINGEEIIFKGIFLTNEGVELELYNVTGLSKITSRVFNNGTQGKVTLYNNNIIVQEIESGYYVSDVVMNVKDKPFDRLRISSFEGAVLSIKLE